MADRPEAVLDATAAAVIAVDLEGRTLFWNRGAEELFGWSREEVLGRPPPIVPEALQQEWQLQMRHALESGHATPTAETQRVARDGRTVAVLRSASPLRDEHGSPIGVVDTLTDFAMHKQLDEEGRVLAQVRERELIAMDLHDGLVQSLYGVVLGLAAAERDLGSEPAVSVLRNTRQQIERVIEETRSYLLDLRVREFTPPDLGAGLRLLIDGLRLNAHLECEVCIDPGVDQLLTPAARGHVLYLVREAVSNVAKHADARRLSLRMDSDADRVAVIIADDGRGFEHPTGGGAGHSGLRNMAERARLVGGQLTIASEPGAGTTVRLDVPRAHGRQSRP